MEAKYVLGLDLGVASIGWSVLNIDENDMPTCIKDHGIVHFNALDNDKGKLYNVDRRNSRGARRVIRRRKERLRRIKKLFMDEFNLTLNDYHNLYHSNQIQDNNVYYLKVKGLDNPLSIEELTRILVHYGKNRGFKSNRKSETEKEKGAMKEAINNIQLYMKKDNCTVTQAMLNYQKDNNIAVLHNSNDAYIYGFERQDVEDEIIKILDNQVKLKVINNEFKDSYLDIFNSQRDFSEGPASGPYKVEFETMFGKCSFRPNENRISRACPSFDLNVLLQKLSNITYYSIDDGVKSHTKYKLVPNEIQKLYNKITHDNAKFNYLLVEKIILESKVHKAIEFTDVPSCSRKDFNDIIKKYKEKHEIADRKLDETEYLEVRKLAKEEAKKKEIYDLKSYKSIKSDLKKLIGSETKDIPWLDDVATILSYAKTDDAVDRIINKYPHYKEKFTKEDIELIKQLDVKKSGTGSLCLSLVQDLNKLLIEGLSYTDAMVKLGYEHSVVKKDKKFSNGFPTIDEIEKEYDTVITQPNVKHVLVYLRKLYNKLEERYGKPTYVHIEVARDIRNSFSERNKLRYEQLENFANNDKAKRKMMEVLGVDDIKSRSFKSFSQNDITKFKLWEEQGHVCIYTGEPIDEKTLLKRNEYQVDHILPFSRTFDDSYSNKALVCSKANQEKGNKTPYEWLSKDKSKWNAFTNRVNKAKISESKRNKLLTSDEISYDEFTAQALHATSYVNKLATSIFKTLLQDENNKDVVRTFKGNATSYLRKYYRLNNLTHSLENINYDRRETKQFIYREGLSFDCSTKSSKVTIHSTNKFGNEESYSIEIKYDKDKGFRSAEDSQLFYMIRDKQDDIINFFSSNIFNKNIFEIEDIVFNCDNNTLSIAILANDLLIGLRNNINQKNRNNHFHHAVDAILVASMTRSMQLKITKFHQALQTQDKRTVIDPDTGEIIDRQLLFDNYTIDKTNKDERFYIPLPYENFIEELKVKVFERDQEVLSNKLSDLGLDDALVKYPSFQANKISAGPLHAETIYGKRIQNGGEVSVIRTAVNNITSRKDLDKLYDANGSQKAIYHALCKWLDNDRKGYPTLSNGQVIKKVKVTGNDITKMVKISPTEVQKGYAGIGEVARIFVYKKDKDNKLYFVQITIEQLEKIKRKVADK